MVSEPAIMVIPCFEVAMSDAERESEARCISMLNKLISEVKKQTVEMEDLAVSMNGIAVGLKAITRPQEAPVHALPPSGTAPTATLVTVVDHAMAATTPYAEVALTPESPTKCSTSGPDTVTPTRCLTAGHSCNTGIAITSHAPSISTDVDLAEVEATPCTDSILATVTLTKCSTPRQRLYEQGGLKFEGLIKFWFRELSEGMLDSLPTEEVMQCQSEDDCYPGGVPWMPPWPPPQEHETLLVLFTKAEMDVQTVKLAGLLHDSGHGPFSHPSELGNSRYVEAENRYGRAMKGAPSDSLFVTNRRLHQLLECKSAGKGRMSNCIKKETVEFTCNRTAAVAEAYDTTECTSSILSFENGYVEPMQFSEPGTNGHALTLVDENPWDRHYEEQHSKIVPSFEISDNLEVQGNGLVSRSLSIKQEPLSIPQFRISEWDDRERRVWSPLYESRLAYRQELQFTVGPGGNVLCVSENEISSIISCALVISEERRHLLDAKVESEAADARGGERTKTMEKSYSFLSEGSSTSSSLSCIGSSDSEVSFSFDDLSRYDSSLQWSPGDRFDISFYLMLLHANQDEKFGLLKTMFSEFSSSYDPLDYHIIWHQCSILEAVGAFNANDLHILDLSFVYQLLCLGKCYWASYVIILMPHLDDAPYTHTSQLEVEWAYETFSNPNAVVLPMHGKLSHIEQSLVFKSYPGRRKIIFCTNIAETSLAIKEVKYVVDSGLAKESRFVPISGLNVLKVNWISQSSTNQRAGRAGRTRAGKCYRLYSESDFSTMEVHQEPEIRKVHLGTAALRILDLGVRNVQNFELVDALNPEAINMAVKNFEQLGAIKHKYDGFELTDTGLHLIKLGIEPRLGKIMLDCFSFGLRKEGVVLASAMANSSSIFCRVGTDEEKYKADCLKVYYEPIKLITECDDVRILSNSRMEFLHHVPDSTTLIFGMGSMSLVALLCDARDHYDKQSAKAYDNYQLITSSLPEAIAELGVKPDDSAIAALMVQNGQGQELGKAQELFESFKGLQLHPKRLLVWHSATYLCERYLYDEATKSDFAVNQCSIKSVVQQKRGGFLTSPLVKRGRLYAYKLKAQAGCLDAWEFQMTWDLMVWCFF